MSPTADISVPAFKQQSQMEPMQPATLSHKADREKQPSNKTLALILAVTLSLVLVAVIVVAIAVVLFLRR